MEIEEYCLNKVREYGDKRINSKPLQFVKLLDNGEYSAFLRFQFKSGNTLYEMIYDYGFGGKQDKPSIHKIA